MLLTFEIDAKVYKPKLGAKHSPVIKEATTILGNTS